MKTLGKVSFLFFSGEFFAEGLDKDLFSIFFEKFFAEGYGQGPRQRPVKF